MLSLFISCESSAGGLLNVSPMRPRMTLPDHDLSSWRFLEFRIAKRPLNAPICPENQRNLWSIFLLVWHLDSLFSFSLFTLFNTFFHYYFFLLFFLAFKHWLLHTVFIATVIQATQFIFTGVRATIAKVMGNFPFVSIATKLCNRFVKLFAKEYCET